jgi:MoaA/NifB/PqqE/SkfB family radical SAM enzyme
MPPRLLIQWHITERCNLQCTHCYQASPQPADPPLPRLLAILGQIRGA